MPDTPLLCLPLLAPSQAQKHITHNEALMRLDALVHLSVASRTLAGPPTNPAEGDRYIVAAGATGLWAGSGHAIASFSASGWQILTPRNGWLAFCREDQTYLRFDGTKWEEAFSPASLARIGINATADNANRLVVQSPASLFSHEGAGHQIKINKARSAETASILLQSGWSGRAEIGLCGDDDLHIKVSADGTAWKDALLINRESGAVQMPFTPGVAENLLLNSQFRINQRGFAGGVLAAGHYGFDRWKAGPAGARLTLAAGLATLTSGALIQMVDPSLFGLAGFAGQTLTLSLEGLHTGSLSIRIGSKSAIMAAGPGRRAATVTLDAGESGPLAVSLAAETGPVSFQKLHLALGAIALPFTPPPDPFEMALCQRYYAVLGGESLSGSTLGGGGALLHCRLPTAMRAAPALSLLQAQWTAAIPGHALNVAAAPVITAILARTPAHALIHSASGFAGAAASLPIHIIGAQPLMAADAEL